MIADDYNTLPALSSVRRPSEGRQLAAHPVVTSLDAPVVGRDVLYPSRSKVKSINTAGPHAQVAPLAVAVLALITANRNIEIQHPVVPLPADTTQLTPTSRALQGREAGQAH
jgi:hypothetical protein